MAPKIVAGDYEGSVEIKIGALWSGPKAEKFKGLRVKSGTTYAPKDLMRVVHLNEESSTSFLGGAVRGVAGALLLGGVGAIAGVFSASGKSKIVLYGLELIDGKKFIISCSHKDKAFMCLLAYAKEQDIFKQDLGF